MTVVRKPWRRFFTCPMCAFISVSLLYSLIVSRNCFFSYHIIYQPHAIWIQIIYCVALSLHERVLFQRYDFAQRLPLQNLICFHTGWYVNCWAPFTSTFIAFTSFLTPCQCWTCWSPWLMHAPSQIMVRMKRCWHFVSSTHTAILGARCCPRDCCMHIRPQPASVTHDRPKNASPCTQAHLPKFLFMCSTSTLKLDLSCPNTFLHGHVLSACPLPSQPACTQITLLHKSAVVR